MDEKIFEIRVDYREGSLGIIEIFTKRGIEVVKDNLKAGDYLIGDEIVVERKTTLDFAQSIIDGRLFRQALLMKQNFDRCLFVYDAVK